MNNAPSSSAEPNKKVSNLSIGLNMMAFIGLFLIFVLIISLTYIPEKSDPVETEISKQRILTVNQVRAENQEHLTGYGWINRDKGLVHVPIEYAMDRTVDAYRHAQER